MDELENMDLNLYKVFLSVVKNGSISKAANELLVSQPSVSYSIKELENQLNCRLFIRTPKGVEITADAQKLLFYVENAFNTLKTGCKMLSDSSDFLSGEIRIGVPTHIGIFFLSQYIQKFNEQYPGINFYIVNKSTNEMVKLLEKRELDLIVDSYPIDSKREDVTILKLMDIDNCFIANKKYLNIIENNKRIKIEDLKRYQLLLPPKVTSTRDMLEKAIKDRVNNLEALIDVPTTEVMLDLVEKGLGIGYFSRNAVKKYIDSGKLFEIPVDVELPKTTICIAYVENFLMNAPKKFGNMIQDEVNRIEQIRKKALRIVVTSDCVYNCRMCHKEGLKNKRKEALTCQDIEFLYSTINKKFGIRKVNITGGEPLLRKDISNIVSNLKNVGARVNITTNGYLLNDNLEIGKDLNRVNISLHTVNSEKFEKITKSQKSCETVINNIKKLRSEYPTLKINISMTLIKGINSELDDIEEMIKFTNSIKANLKIIEIYPKNSNEFISIEELLPLLEKKKFALKESDFRKKVYSNDDINIILERCTCSIVSEKKEKEKECNENNDIYITPDGKISLCRNNNKEIDIYDEITNRREKKLIDKIEEALNIMGKECIC